MKQHDKVINKIIVVGTFPELEQRGSRKITIIFVIQEILFLLYRCEKASPLYSRIVNQENKQNVAHFYTLLSVESLHHSCLLSISSFCG